MIQAQAVANCLSGTVIFTMPNGGFGFDAYAANGFGPVPTLCCKVVFHMEIVENLPKALGWTTQVIGTAPSDPFLLKLLKQLVRLRKKSCWPWTR